MSGQKFLVALQYWTGDREAAIELMRLIGATTEEKTECADFVVWHRFDAEPPDRKTLKILEDAFDKVWVLAGPDQITGHPDGCNALWAALVMAAYRKSTESTRGAPEWSQYKGVLAIEADTCPISADWLDVISEEWDAHKHEACFMGAWQKSNHDHPMLPGVGHINGNAMFSMDLARRVPNCVGTPYKTAWDTYHAPSFKKAGWYDTKAIRSWWAHKTLTDQEFKELKRNQCVLLHGVKDKSNRELFLNSLK